MKYIGKEIWLIPDMYMPESVDTAPYAGHESVCVINTGDEDCEISCRFFFTDREPGDGFKFICPARRSAHVRLNDLCNGKGEKMPAGVPYSAMFICSVPVVIQCTRVDTTQSNLALMSIIAYSV